MPENLAESETLETRHWKEVRCFNIPVNDTMLQPNGFVRQLTCVLKNECPRLKPSKTRLVLFDKDYVVNHLNKIMAQLKTDEKGISDLLK